LTILLASSIVPPMPSKKKRWEKLSDNLGPYRVNSTFLKRLDKAIKLLRQTRSDFVRQTLEQRIDMVLGDRPVVEGENGTGASPIERAEKNNGAEE
jgi:hypothetical protein